VSKTGKKWTNIAKANNRAALAMRPCKFHCGMYFGFGKGVQLEYYDMLVSKLVDALIVFEM